MDKDLIIVARPADGFRRCGVHHPARQVRHPAGTFGLEDCWTLKREPQLVVIEVDPLPKPEAEPVPAPPPPPVPEPAPLPPSSALEQEAPQEAPKAETAGTKGVKAKTAPAA